MLSLRASTFLIGHKNKWLTSFPNDFGQYPFIETGNGELETVRPTRLPGAGFTLQ
jgi:hypothetical protein